MHARRRTGLRSFPLRLPSRSICSGSNLIRLFSIGRFSADAALLVLLVHLRPSAHTACASSNRFVQQFQSVCLHTDGTCLTPSKLQLPVTSRQSLPAPFRFATSCSPFSILCFLNTAMDHFRWGGSQTQKQIRSFSALDIFFLFQLPQKVN